MSLPDDLRHLAVDFAQNSHLPDSGLCRMAADRIEALEAELARCHYFLRVIGGHAEDISTEVGCALHPQIVVDVVKDGSIAYPPGHGPDDPPRPVQRHA